MIGYTFSFFVVGMRIRRKVGPKGQVVIPKVVREHMGIMPGDEVVMEVRGGELALTTTLNPKDFVESFCSIGGKKLKEKIDLDKLLEQEVEERFALH